MKPSIYSAELAEAVTVEEMREDDTYTIENFVSGRELMHRAAMGVYNAVDASKWENKKVAIVSGGGNNGGDGYALACILAQRRAGNEMLIDVIRTSDKLSEDGGFYFKKCEALGVPWKFFEEDMDFSEYDIIVDCILGTGFQGVPRGKASSAIGKINDAGAYVISVDINSGMNGDTGEAELAVKSNKTVSVGFYKKGHFLGKAADYIDDLVNVDIGIVRKP